MAQDQGGLREFLAGIAIFGGLEDKTLDRVIALLKEEQLPAGAAVCREGEPGRSMYVIRSGEVVVCRQGASGKTIKVVRLGAGEFFGEMTLIDIQPRSATVVVDKPAAVYSLTNRDLYTLYREDITGYVMVLQNICRQLSRRLRMADSKITQNADATQDDDTQIGGPLTSTRR